MDDDDLFALLGGGSSPKRQKYELAPTDKSTPVISNAGTAAAAAAATLLLSPSQPSQRGRQTTPRGHDEQNSPASEVHSEDEDVEEDKRGYDLPRLDNIHFQSDPVSSPPTVFS